VVLDHSAAGAGDAVRFAALRAFLAADNATH
jgi:hypothetical protein